MLRKRSLRTWILIAAGLAAALALGIRFSFLASDRIAPGVKIVGVRIGGLTRAEAASRLRDWSCRRLADRLTVEAGGRRWNGALGNMGIAVDVERMVRAAYSVGRRGNVLERFVEGLGIRWNALDRRAHYRYDHKKLSSLIWKMDAAVGTPAKDARLSFSEGIRRVIPESPGTTVYSAASFERIESAVQRGEGSVSLVLAPDRPKVIASDLDQVDTLLSRYTTRFPAWRKDRTHNIRLAVAGIDGKLIRRGEVFSYNEAVGPRVKETGFKDALIYVNGKIIPGTGGGVCQVSSTVYNAALLANLEIVERSHHSMPVPYVPLGRDATVAYGLRDLKFKNTTSAPVYLAARVAGDRLTVEVYGAAGDKRDVSIVITPPKRWRRDNGRLVTAVAVYRVLRENGAEASKTRISYDRYSPAPPHPPHPPQARPRPRPKPSGQTSQA